VALIERPGDGAQPRRRRLLWAWRAFVVLPALLFVLVGAAVVGRHASVPLRVLLFALIPAAGWTYGRGLGAISRRAAAWSAAGTGPGQRALRLAASLILPLVAVALALWALSHLGARLESGRPGPQLG